eukprot:1515972-Karenia_brevis.AAC.1
MYEVNMHRWLKIVTSSDRWKLSCESEHDIINKYRKLLAGFAPIFLKKGSKTFGAKNIPKMHFAVKRKCFQSDIHTVCHDGLSVPSGGAKTCLKENHACLRNI